MSARERIAGNVANYVDERTGAAKWLKKNLNRKQKRKQKIKTVKIYRQKEENKQKKKENLRNLTEDLVYKEMKYYFQVLSQIVSFLMWRKLESQ